MSECPECGFLAEIEERGPAEVFEGAHVIAGDDLVCVDFIRRDTVVKLVCPHGHWFLMLQSELPGSPPTP